MFFFFQAEDGIGDSSVTGVQTCALPISGSAIVGDRNFGIFSTAYGAQQSGHRVILRLTAVRAKSLMGGPIARTGDYPLRWQASRFDRKKHPHSPAPASGEARLIAWRVGSGNHQQWLN